MEIEGELQKWENKTNSCTATISMIKAFFFFVLTNVSSTCFPSKEQKMQILNIIPVNFRHRTTREIIEKKLPYKRRKVKNSV